MQSARSRVAQPGRLAELRNCLLARSSTKPNHQRPERGDALCQVGLMSGGDDGARATVWSYDMCMRYFTLLRALCGSSGSDVPDTQGTAQAHRAPLHRSVDRGLRSPPPFMNRICARRTPHGAVLNNPSFYSTSTTALPLACQSQPLTILIPQLIAVDGRPRRVVGCRVVFCTSVIRHPPRRRLPAVSSSASFASPSLSRIGPSSCQLTRRQPVQSYGS